MKVLLILSFQGTQFHGFQRQEDRSLPTVQSMLEDALQRIFNRQIDLTSASRTDRGVHADEQLVCFDDPLQTTRRIGLDKLPGIINQRLTEDITVYQAREIPADFHPRYAGRVRWYRYYLSTSQDKKLSSQQLNLTYHLNKMSHPVSPKLKINSQILKDCFSVFLGFHDFTTFSSVNTSPHNNRWIYRIEVGQKQDIIWIDFFANAFLRGMVRSLVGNTLHQIKLVQQAGLSKEETASKVKNRLTTMLKSQDKSLAKQRAPAQGLVLKKIFYQPIFD